MRHFEIQGMDTEYLGNTPFQKKWSMMTRRVQFITKAPVLFWSIWMGRKNLLLF